VFECATLSFVANFCFLFRSQEHKETVERLYDDARRQREHIQSLVKQKASAEARAEEAKRAQDSAAAEHEKVH
jgi:hypothetical protein